MISLERILTIFVLLTLYWAQDARAMSCVNVYLNGGRFETNLGPLDAIHHYQPEEAADGRALWGMKMGQEANLKRKLEGMAGHDGWALATAQFLYEAKTSDFQNLEVMGFYNDMSAFMEFARVVEFSGQIDRISPAPDSDPSRPFYRALITKNGISEEIPFSGITHLLIRVRR